ncbi:4-carboxymuconolactone decarboxylase domain/alkylhydroperoxidase AhpD family core domain protein [Microbacterium esteraromaticum]|uniref:4-carboxymuconolactone decarboxylase domain/alkylhydroperoxidase AhpD family core domain protein n=1 Tax=Microbacterium esteraromaticum TaxID=57043 RepID=A0A1R4JMY0_9MICO|nr:carboxymuconolactone decarboxylase family protein [Microbacterium esteraromaticum]SJN33378.1 4-carboxymuconolactone decarboxylase domain/alkylhydroperoxidase AhpD family core domain protein [Microbacterium esteraromaticum]
MRPYLDKSAPDAWKAAGAYSAAINAEAERLGLTAQESEFIKVRASQLNGCAFCLDLHARDARESGIPPQKLDLLPAWRESSLYSERERAVIAVAEAATRMPLSEGDRADLSGARSVLGDDVFVAAEWVALTINMFNRISILSEHPVRARGTDGKLITEG